MATVGEISKARTLLSHPRIDAEHAAIVQSMNVAELEVEKVNENT